MDCKALKRVTVFAGHYGSGKTNIAVNFALNIANSGKNVEIADLDIVNPYFRTKDAQSVLSERGIRLVSSVMANTNVDTPALPAEAYSVIHNKASYAVIDVGGDDRGALAMGRYAPALLEEGNFDMLLVINRYRYLTRNPEEVIEVMREIEDAAGMKFTGIVNNSNVGDETDVQHILESIEFANEVSYLSGLPVKFTTVLEKLADELSGKLQNIMPIKIFVKQSF